MSSSHKYFFILQNQHVTDANVTSFYGPQKLSRKRHTSRGPTSTWWHRSHPAQWSGARNLSSSAMLATVAARFVPIKAIAIDLAKNGNETVQLKIIPTEEVAKVRH